MRRHYVPRDPRPDPRHVGEPQPGFYEVRLARGAATVGARIEHAPTRDPETGEELDRSFWWSTTINGRPDPNPSPQPSSATWRVWHSRELAEIDEERYNWLVKDRAWAKANTPGTAEADPNAAPHPFRRPLSF